MFRKLFILLIGIGLYTAWNYEVPNVSAPTSVQVQSTEVVEEGVATDAPQFASQYTGHDWYLLEKNGDRTLELVDEDGAKKGQYQFESGSTFEGLVLDQTTRQQVENIGFDEVKSYDKGLKRYLIPDDPSFSVYAMNGNYVTMFFDQHDEDKLKGILSVERSVEESSAGYYGDVSAESIVSNETLMRMLMNWDRQKFGLSALADYEPLLPVVRAHSENMAVNNFFSHIDPEGRDPFERMNEAGLAYSLAGENLAMGQMSVFHAHWGLMNSLGHRENILKRDFTHASVGLVYNDDNSPFYTINFITPR
ncbi:SCP-like extracellular family protein [Exiguobacterium sp. SH3S2]|uniref:CAP domain-containing protein n=1 Tax=unclassified Exiguobacterium TaxID=2644629 RepID=UPI00103CB2C0|nr:MULTISPECIES: CAP domain-containing protein [unclassified Exiguobacterium]TCI43414.1 SCP-like extracellular family protein [Exiguobacterium sp. SH3S3]TCI59260.1 SCP-like extracellular family protein [Exiguobacterium sp. SH3S2]TCI66418.1 SCP-like extracellular family protein [Exiguobacterium sp. SH3S1]